MAGFSWKRIVIKVGSALIAPAGKGTSTRYLLAIARFISECKLRGVEVVLVSSGSVAAGRSAIEFTHQPLPINVKQAYSCVVSSFTKAWSKGMTVLCVSLSATGESRAAVFAMPLRCLTTIVISPG